MGKVHHLRAPIRQVYTRGDRKECMAHRKEEYEANGHRVRIQKVNEHSSISAWIDGNAAYLDKAMDHFLENRNDLTEDLAEKIEHELESDDVWSAVKSLLSWQTDCGVYFCPKCDSFYDHNDRVRGGFAGHYCQDCADAEAQCEESPDGEHHDECLNPHQRNNARVSTKYRCKHCGRKRQTTPTG